MRFRGCLALAAALLFLLPLAPLSTVWYDEGGPGSSEDNRSAGRTRGDWIIDTRIVFDSRTVNITNNINIYNGGTLVFNNCKAVIGSYGSADGGSFTFTIEKGGALELIDSEFLIGNIYAKYSIVSYGTVSALNSSFEQGWRIQAEGREGTVPGSERVVMQNTTFSRGNYYTVISLNWTNARFEGCTFQNMTYTTLYSHNSSLVLDDCVFTDNHHCLELADINGLLVTQCLFQYNDIGITATRLTSPVLSSNILQVHPLSGISFSDSWNVTIDETNIEISNDHGLSLKNCENISIKDSAVSLCGNDGIGIYYCWNVSILRTNLSNNHDGIHFFAASGIEIIDCRFFQNNIRGLDMLYTWDILIDSALFEQNSNGLQIDNSRDITFRDSSLISSGGRGIKITSSDSFLVQNVKIVRSLFDDILLEGCSDSSVVNISIMTRETGLKLVGCKSILIEGVDINGSELGSFSWDWIGIRGVDIESCEDISFSDLSAENCEYGFYTSGSYDCRFTDIALSNVNQGFYMVTTDYNELIDIDISFWGDDNNNDAFGIRFYNSNYNLVTDFSISSPSDPTFMGEKGHTIGIFNQGLSNMFVNGTITNTYYGISQDSTSQDNEVYDIQVSFCVYGSSDRGKGNQYRHCSFFNNFYGFFMSPGGLYQQERISVDDCLFFQNYAGMKTDGSEGRWAEIINSRFEQCRFGLIIYDDHRGELKGNTIIDNGYGIYIWYGGYYYYGSEREVEYENTDYNLYPNPHFQFYPAEEAWYYSGMTIHSNNFVRNDHHNNLRRDQEDKTFTKNFFSDYDGKDNDRDGFGDTNTPWARCDGNPRMLPYDPNDSDSDGYNDLTEELVGTDPLNSTSVPRDINNDGIPDGLVQGPSTPSDDDVDDDVNGGDDDEKRESMLPPGLRLLIILVVACFFLMIVFVYFKKFRDSRTPVKRKKKKSSGRKGK